MQCGPNSVAWRTPLHLAGGFGAFQRRSPVGGAANGIPRNWRTPDVALLPSRVPVSIFTRWAFTRSAATARMADAATRPETLRTRRNVMAFTLSQRASAGARLLY